LIKDDAIVLRRLDFSETSQVLAIFTRAHGQQRVIAKGIKRSTKQKASVGIDLLELASVVIFQRAGHEDRMGTITEWQQQDTFPHLRRDLTLWHAAQYAAETVAQLTEVNDPHPELFDDLAGFLKTLGERDGIAALCNFLWSLLIQIGLRPELERCVACGNEWESTASASRSVVLYFSSREGGVICRDCEPGIVEKFRSDADVMRALVEGQVSARPVAARAFNLLDYHLTQIVGRQLRLSAPLKSLLLPKRG
jgi:DNA repair protein RecO (recombination protein O)